jgi:DNA-binding SARP family transcriptional activator
MRTLGRHIVALIGATILVAAVWLLAKTPPPPPPLPSTERFATASGADRLLFFVAWLGFLLIAIGLLYRIVARTRRSGSVHALAMRHLHPVRRAPRAESTRAYANRAFPLILKPGLLSLESASNVEPPQPNPANTPAHQEDSSRSVPLPAARVSVLGPLTVAGTRKKYGRGLRGATRELLAYLALHPNGAHRDQIIDALWPDESPEQGRKRLWRAAADARTQLGDGVVTRESDHYDLDRSRVSVDLDLLEHLLTELGPSDETATQLPKLERALALFSGQPFEGSDLPWAENEQRRLHAIQLDLFARVSQAHLSNGNASQALASAEEGLALEPYNEELARLAMQAEAELGLRSAVMGRYDALRQLLEEQLGLQPHRETRTLYRRLLSQD